MQRESAVVVALEPHDVARTRIVQTSRDRPACGGELTHAGLELGELVLVAAEVPDPLRREPDACDRIRKPLPGELDRKPAVVARAQTGGDARPLLRRPGDRHQKGAERIEHLGRAFERALDIGAEPLGGIGTSRVA